MDSVRVQPRRYRFTALSTAILTCAGLAACLSEPEPVQRIPVLPALPVLPVETAELDPLTDIRPMVAALMRSLPYRNDADWHDWQVSAMLPFIEADRRSAPLPALLDALADPDLATRRGAAIPADTGTSWTDPALCLGRSDYALGGLRPWDTEQKAWDLLGEPGGITGGWSESDGGAYANYRYRYPNLEVDLASYGVEMLSTTSPTIVVGQDLRIGMSREQILSEVFGIPSSAEALAARRYRVSDCENPYQEVYFHLEFDRDGLLWRMQLFAEQP